ncbi:MAG: MBL fold metallo-hydrolase [Myxococcota bacterium]
MLFEQLKDPDTSTFTYLLADPQTGDAVLIDPVLVQIERDIERLEFHGLTLRYTLDTHVHADHVTAAGALRDRFQCQTVLSAHAGVRCADMLLADGEEIRFGSFGLTARTTPGHTQGCVTYVTLDQKIAFTGDALLIGGCGRTDFQGGDARTLYRSIHAQVFSLPGDTLLYPAHDYKGRCVTTVSHELEHNARLGSGRSEDDFVAIMENLDLAYPKHIDRALPLNMGCGLDGSAASAVELQCPEVDPEWAYEQRERVTLIDCREPHELVSELGHASHAECIPQAEVRSVVSDWNRDRPIAVVCRSGVRSNQVALLLAEDGFTDVASVRGGMMLWNECGLPTEGGS